MKWEHYYASLADPSLSLPRFGHSAVAVTDASGSCQVLVYGGVGCNAGETAQTALGDVAVLQTESRTWSAPDILPGPGPGPRAFHSAVAVAASHEGGGSSSTTPSSMLVFGGHILTFEDNRKRRNFYNDIWRLDLAEWQWRQVPAEVGNSLPAKRDMCALLQLQEGQLLLFGGRSEQGKALQDTWLYSVASNTWQQLKPVGALPPARKMHTMAKVGSQVVLFGGEADNGPLDDVWLLAGFGPTETLRWTQVKMRGSPTPRFGHAIATVSVSAADPAAAVASSRGSSRRSSEAGSTAEPAPADEEQSPFQASAVARTPGDSDSGAAAAEADNPAVFTTSGSAAGSVGSLPQQQQQQQPQQRVVVFGGCLDLSGFLSLNKNYVQTKETWLLQLDQLTWTQLPQPPPPAAPGAAVGGSNALADAAAAAAPPWPCERMCHSLTGLSDGRLLVVGGRNKEGICRDMWLLDASGEISAPESSINSFSSSQPVGSLNLPPASPRPSTAGSTGSAAAGSKPSPRPVAGSQSLLQSLLGPVRARVPSQGLLARRDSNSQVTAATGGAAESVSTPATSTPSSSQPTSPKRQQQQPPQDVEHQQAAVDGADATKQSGGMHGASSGTMTPVSVAAAMAAAGVGGSSSSSQQSLQTLMDVSSGEFAKLLRNPAAYSAGAINKLSSTVTSTVSSLLVGKDGQPGPMLPRLPEALMRVAPNFGLRGSGADSSSSLQQQHQGINMPALTPLRQHMSLELSGQGQLELRAPSNVLQGLALLGQQLLSDGGEGSLPADVLVAAARQHLMSATAMQLKLPHVALLLADYQQLAASYYAHTMLSRLSEGFSSASQAADGEGKGGSAFLQRQPTDLLIHQVQALQAQYQQLLLHSAA